MACKEAMVTAPVAVLVYDATFRAQSLIAAVRRRRALYGGLAATWIVLAFLIADAPRFRSAGFGTGISPWTYLLNQVVMISTYLKLSIWPDPLILDYGPTRPIDFVTALPYGLLVGLLVALVAAGWVRGYRTFAFLGTWFFLTLAPASSIVPIATEVGAERRMYLPLAAVVAAIVLGVRAVTTHWPAAARLRRSAAGWSAAALVATVSMVMTAGRNREYSDPVGLWESVLDHRPHGRAHHNLAIALRAAGRVDEAMAHYRAALPDEPAAHYALGFELLRAGQFADAERELTEYVRQRPEDALVPRAMFLRGQALVRLGRPLDAEGAFREAIRMTPRNPDAYGALADLLVSLQRPGDAVPLYRTYVTLVPAQVEALQGLALALYATGQGREAVELFQKAAAMRPADPDVRMNLAHALAAQGRLPEAIAEYRAGLALAPTRAPLMSALAVALAASGERDEPLALFARARQLAPNDPNVQSDYETALAHWRGR
jgi:Flp pilus assembly protein TadD